MATVTIKNIPDDLYKKLKESAKANRRSINNEVILLIEQAFQTYRPRPEELEAEARKLRELTAHYHLTNEELDQWKNEGRP
ncbi:MAG: Arc family DNA-binding protein [Chloroflexi bacterium]|nr:MAG: Arc family DNA-binding protein [Chloroflexota bacterium]